MVVCSTCFDEQCGRNPIPISPGIECLRKVLVALACKACVEGFALKGEAVEGEMGVAEFLVQSF
jgi:hypothetical protein